MTAALVACGGGGGSAGTGSGGTGSGSSSGSGSGSGSGSTGLATMTLDLLGGAGAITDTISTVEIATARVTLKNSSGIAVKGAIVSFGQSGAGLVAISPASATALTDGNGQASVEVRAASTSSTGATSLTANALVATTTVTAIKAFAVTGAPSTGTANPQDLANALNFLDTNPADKSIVLAGSGGNGRSESATLRFRVVDKNNAPVKGAAVSFSVIPPNDVTLNIPSTTSDTDGVVLTTVSSKNVATAVVVKATVTGKSIVSQSDQLLVTTGIATQAGFDLSASKYNLNLAITGDSSTITVRIVDTNGNPVSDGVPVVFTADFGAVGTSSMGGCLTTNGGCTVIYTVQDPRPADGTPVTVTASTQVGSGTSISRKIQLSVIDPADLNLFDAITAGAAIGTINIDASCAAKNVMAFVGTAAGYPAPASTAVTFTALATGLTTNVLSGASIQDQLSTIKQRTPLVFEVSPPSGASPFPCVPGGAATKTAGLEVKFTAGTISQTRIVAIRYPVP
ncbi:MAG: hypothetical protein JWQ88_496 [Rhodoferax sp.]|nr:hypothetical protein [Rhodoferax sp.]